MNEPLRTPGTIQPFGVLIIVDIATFTLRHVSDNADEIFRRSATSILGTPLEDLIGRESTGRLRARARDPLTRGDPVPIMVAAGQVDVILHVDGQLAIIEFEPRLPSPRGAETDDLYSVIQRLQRLVSSDAVRVAVVEEVRRLTGFDRVMIYHFHPDGHGEVVAEDRLPEMDPYLGFHFPASDIPAQARTLYLTKHSRSIATNSYTPVEILSSSEGISDLPLDLSQAELRSISPHHLQFMANIGQASSLSLSLVRDGHLIGMITCAHRTPRLMPSVMRRGLEVLAGQVALQLDSLDQVARMARELDASRIRTSLVDQVELGGGVADALTKRSTTLLDLVPADGALISYGGTITRLGHATPSVDGEALTAWVTENRALLPFATASLAADAPGLARSLPMIAGILIVSLGSGSGFIAWCRLEVSRSISWLGSPAASNRATPVSPRNSFALWQQAVADTSTAWREAEVNGATGLSSDLNGTFMRRLESQLAYFAVHDQLTGLPNRLSLERHLDDALSQSDPEQITALFIDLDRFKAVNDSLGHRAGDALLQEAARRIADTVTPEEFVARLGGDEFIVLCSGERASRSADLADLIVAAFREPIVFQGSTVLVTVSVGLASSTPGGSTAELLSEADLAMYSSKDLGRNRMSRFESLLGEKASSRFHMEQALRVGIGGGELLLEYQTVSRTSDQAAVGVEALVRWHRDGLVHAPPNDFIPLAESTGLIIPLGRWVISEAVTQLGAWRHAGVVGADFTMAINLSPVQLSDSELLRTLDAACDSAEVSKSSVILEITESSLVSEGSPMTDVLNSISGAGYVFSIDDFGTGHSSLSYLRYLPTGQIKIDRSFVSGLLTNPRDAALVAAVIGLAHDFGMICVAEGVETSAQLEALQRLGCDLAQGFLLGAPVSAADVRIT
ncbi:EAL domain-containing protein [Herbiconiux sp. CPCC 205763]|uniref:EAL domain-containing protein n=1 Tax=Herbiconiux aconitum TaxID=2970913 RepID=A0ABT2GSD6_9MICO|nr:EAL domain-containing protein [Herbiconiux aconitum]MCS5718472.1 EAL domain-containing protein [Herbiconiux aconitum]